MADRLVFHSLSRRFSSGKKWCDLAPSTTGHVHIESAQVMVRVDAIQIHMRTPNALVAATLVILGKDVALELACRGEKVALTLSKTP